MSKTLNDVVSIHERKRGVIKKMYKEMLDSFVNKIKNIADAGRNMTVLEVPWMMPGYPRVSRDHACAYLARQLTLLGFKVGVQEPNLYVSWPTKSRKRR